MHGGRANGEETGRRPLPPEAVLRALPPSPEAAATVRSARERLRALGQQPLLHGQLLAAHSGRVRLAGPERLVDPEAAFRCARQLRRQILELRERGEGPVIVMRTFVEALVRDPLRDGSRDPNLGIATARQLLLRINELGVPCAIEAPGADGGGLATPYLEDLTACQVALHAPPRAAPEPAPGRPLSDAQLLRALPQSALAERR